MDSTDTRRTISRLLHRFGFGPTPGQFATLIEHGVAATQRVVLRAPVADPGLVDLVEPVLADLGPLPAARTTARKAYENELYLQTTQLMMWWLDRMALAQDPLAERMTWFWHGHWATSLAKVRFALAMKNQNDTLRAGALGNFADLSRAMVLDGALIFWLDGQRNVASAPNENLGREFLELFTLGVGNFTEDDVKAAARAFTGYRLGRSSDTVTFDARRHDASAVTLLGTTGSFDATTLSDYVVSLAPNASFIASRAWFRFGSSTTPAPTSLTAAFESRDVSSLIRSVVHSSAMSDPRNSMVKSPVEWFVGACRALRVQPSTLPSSNAVMSYLNQMGQLPFYPPNVGGWPHDEAWLSASAAQLRLSFAAYVIARGDLSPLAGERSTTGRLQALADWLGVVAWSDRTAAALVNAVHSPSRLVQLALSAPEYVVNA